MGMRLEINGDTAVSRRVREGRIAAMLTAMVENAATLSSARVCLRTAAMRLSTTVSLSSAVIVSWMLAT